MPTETSTLKNVLETFTKEGALYEKLENGKLRCFACGHRCVIFDGLDGICRVRFNRGGKLLVPHGYVGALQLDPVEKKPFFHALPGSLAMSFGMLGCDFHCGYCQNWVTSQALRDPSAVAPPQQLTPQQFVSLSPFLLPCSAESTTSSLPGSPCSDYRPSIGVGHWRVNVSVAQFLSEYLVLGTYEFNDLLLPDENPN